MSTIKGFIKDHSGNHLLPITRGELVLDSLGNVALTSAQFLAGDHTDAAGNALPGLVTAAERALIGSVLGNTGAGNNINDIYNKLNYINSGLVVGDSVFKFYEETTNENGLTTLQAKKIGLNTVQNGAITITPGIDDDSNNIYFDLKEIEVTNEGTGRISSIETDGYGRLTKIVKSDITNSEIPTTLSGKTLSGCTATDIDSQADGTSIANKNYVDSVYNSIATGALVFGGSFTYDDKQEYTQITNILVQANKNKYYKVTKDFNILNKDLTGGNSLDTSTTKIKAGDTLIVHTNDNVKYYFVHIPSGDDITNITVLNDSSIMLDKYVGNVTFNYKSPFTISVQNNIVGIDILHVSCTQESGTDGILSWQDYKEFKSYASKSITYDSTVTNTTDHNYKIGSIKFDNTEYNIYGVNTTYSLSVASGDDLNVPNNNPKLEFFTSGHNNPDTSITYIGLKGVKVSTEDTPSSIIIEADIAVNNDSTQYLLVVDGYKLKAKFGYIDNSNNNTIVDGLISYSDTISLLHGSTTSFEYILYSLIPKDNDQPSEKYKYGNDTLISAITVNI